MSKKIPHIKQESPGIRLRQYTIIVLLFYMQLFVSDVTAQVPVHMHYNIKDGLPSNKIYSVRQAPDGYIWVSTNKGIARFDGNRFRNFSVSDGLPTNDVFYTYTDVSGKTWLSDFKNGIHYLKDDSLHTIYDQGKVTAEEVILPATYDKGRICVAGLKGKKFGWHWYIYKDTLRNNIFYDAVSRKFIGEDIAYCDFVRAVVLGSVGSDSICFVQSNSTRTIKVSRATGRGLRAYQPIRTNIKLYYNKLIFQISPKSVLILDLQDLHTTELTIDVLKTSQIIAINTNNSSLEITTNTGLIILDHSLNVIDTIVLSAFAGKEDISVATKDRSGNIWIATRDNGIYVVPFFYRKVQKSKLPATAGTIIKSVQNGTHTYLLNTKNHLLIYDKGQYQRTIFLPDRLNPGRIPENSSLLPDGNNGMYISSTKGVWYLDAQGRLTDIVPLFCENPKVPWALSTKTAFYDVPNDRYYIASHNKIFSLKPGHSADTGVVNGRYNHMAFIDSRNVWLANDNGISQWEKIVADGDVKFKPTGPVKELQVENMIPDGEGNVITQIGGKGIMVFSANRPAYLIAEPGVQLIKLIGAGLCAVSDKGIRVLTLNAGKYGTQSYYPNIKGLLYDEVYDLYDNDREIIAMTKSGTLKIPLGPLDYRDTLFTRKPEIFVIYAGRRLQPTKDHVEQRWQNSNISFSISSFSASYLGSIRYEYFIIGLDNTRRYTSEPQITYPVLSPGTYYFHIRAKVNDLDITSEEVVLTLIIQPRWWQSLWFKAGICLLVLTTVVLFFARRIKRTRIRSQYQSSLEHKAAQMELMALQSQMNPHFIFNALGAVKSHFKFNRVQEAEKMLEDFAQLIRMYLEFSKNQTISLQQDILALQIYTAIEQRRFEYKFSVHFFNRITTEQESNWHLPPMVLQPFVENAINHGLFRRQEKGGRLRLFFLHQENRLTVVIDDNGVGRKRAAEMNSRFHKLYPSRGNNLIADRIQVLNGLGIAKIKYEIIDKYNRQSESDGTRVIIHFLKS